MSLITLGLRPFYDIRFRFTSFFLGFVSLLTPSPYILFHWFLLFIFIIDQIQKNKNPHFYIQKYFNISLYINTVLTRINKIKFVKLIFKRIKHPIGRLSVHIFLWYSLVIGCMIRHRGKRGLFFLMFQITWPPHIQDCFENNLHIKIITWIFNNLHNQIKDEWFWQWYFLGLYNRILGTKNYLKVCSVIINSFFLQYIIFKIGN